MRITVVRPGPAYSVEDVARGWSQAFADLGHEVYELGLGERLDFFTSAHLKDANGEWFIPFTDELAGEFANEGLLAHCFKGWPHLLFIVSAFYVSPRIVNIIRARGIKVVVLFTESPYEEIRQQRYASETDLNAILLNDPMHLEQYRGLAPVVKYQPQCYDPSVHSPGPSVAAWEGDVAWVGTPYPSRLEVMERVDWSGLRLRLAGNWTKLDDDHPLAEFVIHDRGGCFNNQTETVQLYRSVSSTFQQYRREAHHPELVDGWALGPREIEAAACGILCVREPRGEGDELLGMVPTFVGPEDLGDLLRWWCSHDTVRAEVVTRAYERIADRTFIRAASDLLDALDAVPATH